LLIELMDLGVSKSDLPPRTQWPPSKKIILS
jgi:hypothetical protein